MTNLSCSCGALQVSCCPDLSEEEVFLMKIILTLLERQTQIPLFFLLNSYFARPFPNSGPSWFLPPARNSLNKNQENTCKRIRKKIKKRPSSGIRMTDFHFVLSLSPTVPPRRSAWVPTRRIGTVGPWCFNSGSHCKNFLKILATTHCNCILKMLWLL